MGKTKLLPCPFCGGKAEIVKAHNSFPLPYSVVCNTDGCNASVGNFKRTKEEAVQAWNTRKPMDAVVEKLKKDTTCRFRLEGYIPKSKAIEIVRKGGLE